MKQRDIVLVPFPFPDQSGSKIRPALVLSNDRFNQASEDIVLCAITSNIKANKYSLPIGQAEIEQGMLYDASMIKIETLLKIRKHLVIKTIATIKKHTFEKTITLLAELVKPA